MVQNEAGGYEFVAGIHNLGDEPWTVARFETAREAKEWLHNTEQKRARARRKTYAFPVTVRRYRGQDGDRGYRYEAGLLKGVNATDGTWRVTVGDRSESFDAANIHKRMDPDAAERAESLATTIASLKNELADIESRVALNLPHSRLGGRMNVDKAITADEIMVRKFDMPED